MIRRRKRRINDDRGGVNEEKNEKKEKKRSEKGDRDRNLFNHASQLTRSLPARWAFSFSEKTKYQKIKKMLQ